MYILWAAILYTKEWHYRCNKLLLKLLKFDCWHFANSSAGKEGCALRLVRPRWVHAYILLLFSSTKLFNKNTLNSLLTPLLVFNGWRDRPDTLIAKKKSWKEATGSVCSNLLSTPVFSKFPTSSEVLSCFSRITLNVDNLSPKSKRDALIQPKTLPKCKIIVEW